MKLKRLYLGDYRVLRDLEISFCPPTERSLTFPRQYSLDFLVGKNGTGKSTVLKILWDLMKQLEGNPVVDYPFILEYELGKGNQKRSIKIATLQEDDETGDVTFTKTPLAWENGEPTAIGLDILPDLIVSFTTGDELEWNLFNEPAKDNSHLGSLTHLAQEEKLEILKERAIRELPGHQANLNPTEEDTEKDSRCLFISNKQINLLTLCGLLVDLANSKSELAQVLEELQIKSLTGFSLKFRLNQGITKIDHREQVIKLGKFASHILHQGSDYRLVFDLTSDRSSVAQEIIQEFVSGLELFKKLAKLADVDENGQSVLREVSIFLERTDSQYPEAESEIPPLHLWEWLSDGERSFLGRMCLFTLLGSTEALILLDEPEVHFNDFWKRQIVNLLDATLKDRHSHVLMTTHSSITLTDVPKEDVIVLKRPGNYTKDSLPAPIQTFAANPSDIMVHVFDAPYPEGKYSVDCIERELKATANQNLAEKREALERLLSTVAQGYWSYRIRRELSAIEV